MSIKVQIEGKGQVAEFPDGTDPNVIDAAIKRDFFSAQPEPPVPLLPSHERTQKPVSTGGGNLFQRLLGINPNRPTTHAKEMGGEVMGQTAADFLRVPGSLLWGALSPISEMLTQKDVLGTEQIPSQAQGLEAITKFLQPKTPMGEAVAKTIAFPFTKTQELEQKGLEKLGVPQEISPELSQLTAMGTLAAAGEVAGRAKRMRGLVKDKEIYQTVQEGFEKGVKPSIRSVGSSLEKRKAYYDRAVDSTVDIVENKNNIRLYNPEGAEVVGKVPKNEEMHLQAVDQRMHEIFNQYNTMKKQAGEAGAMVNITPLKTELRDLVFKSTKSTVVDQSLVNAAKLKLKRLELYPDGMVPLETVQNDIAILNAKLKPGLAKVGYKDFGSFHADALHASFLRKALDEMVTKEKGAGYQELKNLYGAHRAIEEDVARRVNQIAGTPPKGIIDMSDVWIGYHALYSTFTGNIESLIAAGSSALIKRRINYLRKPDTYIEKMFTNLDRLIEKRAEHAGTGTAPPPSELSGILDKYASSTPEVRATMRRDISKRMRNLRGVPKAERKELIERWNELKD